MSKDRREIKIGSGFRYCLTQHVKDLHTCIYKTGKLFVYYNQSTMAKHDPPLKRNLASLVKPSIDNSAPLTYTHMFIRPKKLQLELERYSTIQRNNRFLLERLATVQREGAWIDNKKLYDVKSLNTWRRQQDMINLAYNNQVMISRLQDINAYHNKTKLEDEYLLNQKYKATIGKFPPNWPEVKKYLDREKADIFKKVFDLKYHTAAYRKSHKKAVQRWTAEREKQAAATAEKAAIEAIAVAEQERLDKEKRTKAAAERKKAKEEFLDSSQKRRSAREERRKLAEEQKRRDQEEKKMIQKATREENKSKRQKEKEKLAEWRARQEEARVKEKVQREEDERKREEELRRRAKDERTKKKEKLAEWREKEKGKRTEDERKREKGLRCRTKDEKIKKKEKLLARGVDEKMKVKSDEREKGKEQETEVYEENEATSKVHAPDEDEGDERKEIPDDSDAGGGFDFEAQDSEGEIDVETLESDQKEELFNETFPSDDEIESELETFEDSDDLNNEKEGKESFEDESDPESVLEEESIIDTSDDESVTISDDPSVSSKKSNDSKSNDEKK